MNWILITLDSIVFLVFFMMVAYLFVFALNSLRNSTRHYKVTKKECRIVVLYPAYKADAVICSSVEDFLTQDYPEEKFDVVVIADQLKPETITQLSQCRVQVIEATYENSSKAKAMNLAIDTFGKGAYDVVVVMDADNTADSNFLKEINRAYASGIKAVQAHRVAKNRDTDTAVLDAISEEINNSIFRKGHVNMGFSSALIGSGMAFDYKWFFENMPKVSSMGEDKELEMLLLQQGVFIDYLEDVKVYDMKTQKSGMFYDQRRRWMAAQIETLARTFKNLPEALANQNYDYVNKIVQWMMLPRAILLGGMACIAVGLTFYDWIHAIKWWMLFFLMMFTLSTATPDYLVDMRFYRAMRKLPLLMLLMTMNFMRLRGAKKEFIHTEHDIKQ